MHKLRAEGLIKPTQILPQDEKPPEPTDATEYRYHTAEDVRQQGLYILATWEAFNEAIGATKRMEAKAEELRLRGAEATREREAAKAVAAKSAEEWAAKTKGVKRKVRRERAGKSGLEKRLADDPRGDAANKDGNASAGDASGNGEEEARRRQEPQQASTDAEGRESEREIGGDGDGASEVSANDEKGIAGKNKRISREMSESEREGEEGGAASGAQGGEDGAASGAQGDDDGAASGAQGDEEQEGGESEESGGGAGKEREENAGNAEAGEREGGAEAERGGRRRNRKRQQRRAEQRGERGAGDQARVEMEEAKGDNLEEGSD